METVDITIRNKSTKMQIFRSCRKIKIMEFS